MTDTINNIFKTNIGLLRDIDRAVFYFREQQLGKALGIVVNSIDRINLALELIVTDREYFRLVDTESMFEMLTGILTAQRNKDYVLLTDLLELQLINFLISVQELIISKEEIMFDEDSYRENIELLLKRENGFTGEMREPINTAHLLENGYSVEFTSCGLMTLAAVNNGSKFYFHTNCNVYSEAFLLASHWYQKGINSYVIFGLGMGYHIRELQSLALEATIEIYEPDRNVVMLACAFTDMKELLNNKRISLIYDPDLKRLSDRIDILKEDEVFHIHYPSYMNLKSSEGKKLVESKNPWPEVLNI